MIVMRYSRETTRSSLKVSRLLSFLRKFALFNQLRSRIGSLLVNNEPWLVRTISHNTGTRSAEFRDAIRSRDRRCIITGHKVRNGFWTNFEAAHVFPLAYKGHWNQYDYGRWITTLPANGDSINSIQNGLLLRRDIHGIFDSYEISINPDVCTLFPINVVVSNHLGVGQLQDSVLRPR